MMNDEDIKEYHNIGRPIKYSDKYRYVSGQMYEHHGSRMYDFGNERLPSVTTIGTEAKPMAEKIIEIGLTPVDEYYGSEVSLYYPGLYAGSTDLICLHNGKETIVDFKQANKPKKKEWIEDYYLQIAAYAMAHDYVHKSKIEQGVIMMCTPDLYYQEFVINGAELRRYKHKFLKRLDMYHDLKFDEKEKVKPMNPEDFFNGA
jgi:genome maintenance exonuclease 1